MSSNESSNVLKIQSLFHENYSKFLSSLEANNRTESDEILSNARQCLKLKQYRKLKDILNQFESYSPFHMAEKHRLLAKAYRQNFNFEKCLGELIQCEKYLERANQRETLFQLNFQIVMIQLDLELISSAMGRIEFMAVSAQSYSEKLMLKRSLLSYYLKTNDILSAKEIADEIEEQFALLDSKQLLIAKRALVDFYIAYYCTEVALKKIRKIYNHRLSSDAYAWTQSYFLKTILGHENSGLIPTSVKEKRLLATQVYLIKALINKDQLKAMDLWERLHITLPEIFGPSFEIISSQNSKKPFALCLERFVSPLMKRALKSKALTEFVN